ncbi:response regulator transcription factor, partial [Streptomyces sp. NPDC002690]
RIRPRLESELRRAGRCRGRRGRCLIAAGRPETGLPSLAGIVVELSGLGARDDADRVARDLRRLGWSDGRARGRGRPGYGDRLSPRELEVARLVTGGHTNRQIADALVVSVQTVGSQVTSAMRKLRVTTRTALAVRLMELGLVGEEARSPADDD